MAATLRARHTIDPALVWIVWPVTCLLAGRQRNTITAATSSALDTRWSRLAIGPSLTRRSRSPSLSPRARSAIGVVVMPGATALTLMPWGPSSPAPMRVSDRSPAFDDPYAGVAGRARNAEPELTLTILPPSP